MKDRNTSNKPLTDRSVYGKLTRGEPLTTEDLELILDSNSVDNIVKLNYENLMTNIELDKYFEEKRELKEAALASIAGIIEYIVWQEEQKNQQAQETIKQQMLAEFDLEEYPTIESSNEKGWMSKFIENLFSNLFSKEEQGTYDDLESKIEETAKNSGKNIDARTIKAALSLATGSPTLQAFMFHRDPAHKDDYHCQLVANRILHVASVLQEIHPHKFMKDIKTHLENAKAHDQKHTHQSPKLK